MPVPEVTDRLRETSAETANGAHPGLCESRGAVDPIIVLCAARELERAGVDTRATQEVAIGLIRRGAPRAN